jgi:hypothetical protein
MNQENTNNQPKLELQDVLKMIYDNLFVELGVDEMSEDIKEKVADTLEKLAMSKFKVVIMEAFQDKPEVLQKIVEIESLEALNEIAVANDFDPQALMNACFAEAKLELAKDIAFIQGNLAALKKEVGADE